jgi:ACS family hexuronate transporter-like MFS transporter
LPILRGNQDIFLKMYLLSPGRAGRSIRLCAKERGMAFGFMMLSPTAGVLLANGIVPSLVEHFHWRTAFSCVGWVAVVVAVLLFGYVHNFIALAAIACVLGFLNGYANTFVPLLVSEYSGEEWAASAGGVTGSIFQMASIAGPFVMGVSIDLTGTFTFVWWILAGGPLVGAVLLYMMRSPLSAGGK